MPLEPPRCEGYRRNGGAFTLGPVKWERCSNPAVVLLDVRNPDGSVVTASPACQVCWDEAKSYKGMEIIKHERIAPPKPEEVDHELLSKLFDVPFTQETKRMFSGATLLGCDLVYDSEQERLTVEKNQWELVTVNRTLLLDAPEAAREVVACVLDAARTILPEEEDE